MIDHDELKQAADDADPTFLEVADRITERLQAGEEIDIRYYVRRYPQWAGAICKLLPTMQHLVDYGSAIDRDRRRNRRRVNPNDGIDHQKP